MSEALGLSIGAGNLVAARAGGVPVSRGSVLTVSDQRKSEVGLPDQDPNSNEPGLVIRGFVERVGDRAPMVAADGKRYSGAALTVEALEAMARIVGFGTPGAIAVPAYWSDGQIAALRNELPARPALAPNGVQPLLISDAKAAAKAVSAKPGFPMNGVVVLCDFGASGTSISLILPGSKFQQIGQSVRHAGFSGNEIDQLIANHLQAKARNARTVSLNEALRSGMPVLPARDCRRVKEQLSTADVTSIGMGIGADVRLSRRDFEKLISQPLDRVITSVEETLQRNRIPRTDLTAVATVGGGASIPLITARVSERLRIPVFTAPQPAFAAAVGAAILARQQPPGGDRRAPSPAAKSPSENIGTRTTMASTPPTMANMPPTMANMPPTMANMPPTTASTPPTMASPPPPRAVTPPRIATPPTGTPQTQTTPTAFSGERPADAGSAPGALAWSEESGTGQEPVPYAGPEHADEHADAHVEEPIPDHEEEPSGPPQRTKLPWYKRTALVLTLAGAGAAVLAAGGLALSLSNSKTSPTETTTPSQPETSEVTTTTEPSTTPITTTTEEPPPTSEVPATTTYIPPPPSSFEPTRTNQPPTTTPSQKNSKPSPTPSPPTTTKNHGPFFPPPFGPPTPKH
jgi:hypothetical protein